MTNETLAIGVLLSKEVEKLEKILERLSKEQFIDVWAGTPRKKLPIHESIKEVLRVHLIEIMNNALDEFNKEFNAL